MEALPQELIDKIVEHVYTERDDLPYHPTVSPQPPGNSQVALACISRRWQYAFERQSFRSLQIKSDELENFGASKIPSYLSIQFPQMKSTSGLLSSFEGAYERAARRSWGYHAKGHALKSDCVETVTNSGFQVVREKRRNHLQILDLTIILPPCSEDNTHLFEQESDRQVNDEAFSRAFHHLFRILSTWTRSDARKEALSLRLQDIHCPSDPDLEMWPPEIVDRQRYSYICLRRAEDLPLVPIISGFDMRMNSLKRRIAPRTGVELLARMPMVSWAFLPMPDTEDRYPALRRRNREDLASVLRSQSLPSSLDEDLAIDIESHAGANQTWNPTNLLSYDGQPDPVSSAIWESTSKLNGLRHLKIEGSFDHSLLWPGPLTTRASSIPPTIPMPFWQSITRMVIHFDLRTPSGEWYFRAPDGIDVHDPPFFDSSQPEAEFEPVDRDVLEREMPPGYNLGDSRESLALHRFQWSSNSLNSGKAPFWVFRLVPEEHLLFPMIEAWARAVSQMPKVTRAILRTDLQLPLVESGIPSHYRWSLKYISPCQCSRCSDPNSFVREGRRETHCSGRTVRGLLFHTLTWRPDGNLLELLRGIGSRYHAGRMEECYFDAGSFVHDLGL